MFRKLTALACVLLILVGCQDAYITAPYDDVLFTIEGTTVSKKDLFNVMKLNDDGSIILSDVQAKIYEKLVPTDDAFNKEVAELLAEQKASYGDLWATLLSYYGYTTDEEYAEKTLAPSLRQTKALTKAMSDDYDNLVKDLYVRKVAILEVSPENATGVLDALKNGTTWADAVKDKAVASSSYTGVEQIVTKNSTIDSTALSYIISQTEAGISEAITIPSKDTSVFIVNILIADQTELKDEAIETFVKDSSYQKTYIAKLLKDNNFKIYDKDIYGIIETNYPGALAN